MSFSKVPGSLAGRVEDRGKWGLVELTAVARSAHAVFVEAD
jgi:hypothetical protein